MSTDDVAIDPEYVRRLVAEAPPATPEQLARIRAVLGGDETGSKAA